MFERCNLTDENVQHGRIFVSHVEIDSFRLDCPCCDQGALEHAVRLSFEIVPIFEGTGFAFVAVDGHGRGAG